MNEKEIAEIRRRFRIDKSGVSSVRGCYVNDVHEIVSEFDQSLGLMTDDEAEQVLTLLKKALSGAIGKNLTNIEFSTEQVTDGEGYQLLMTLRNSELRDDEAVQTFYKHVISDLNIEGSYMILLAHDAYDVPYRTKNDDVLEDGSEEVFSFIICAICPLKLTKKALSYYNPECRFVNVSANQVIASPELGFMFPAFDDRSTNIYGTLYYTKNLAENHKEFADAVFQTEITMPPAEQKLVFRNILSGAVAEDCSLEVVQAVHTHLSEMIAEHKESKEPEPLKIGIGTVSSVLKDSGVSETHITEFETKYEEEFGAEAEIHPVSIIDTRQMEVSLPDVSIRVKPERGDLIETRVIDGTRYILIRADEEVEVNGVSISIPEQ